MRRGNINNRMLFFATFTLLLAGFFASSYEDSITGEAFGRSFKSSSWNYGSNSGPFGSGYRPSTPVQQQVQQPQVPTVGKGSIVYTLTCSQIPTGVTVFISSKQSTYSYTLNNYCMQPNTVIAKYKCKIPVINVASDKSPPQTGDMKSFYSNNIVSQSGAIITQGEQCPSGTLCDSKSGSCVSAPSGGTPAGQPQKQSALYTLKCSSYKGTGWSGISVKATFTSPDGKVSDLTERPFRNSVCDKGSQLVYTCSQEGGSLTVPSADPKPLSLQDVYNKIPSWTSNPQSPLVKAAITPCTVGSTGGQQPSPSTAEKIDYGVTCTKDQRGYTTTLVYESGKNGDPATLKKVAQEVIAPTCSPGTSGPSQVVRYRPCGERSTALVTVPAGTVFNDQIRLQLQAQVLAPWKTEMCLRNGQVGVCAPAADGGCIA